MADQSRSKRIQVSSKSAFDLTAEVDVLRRKVDVESSRKGKQISRANAKESGPRIKDDRVKYKQEEEALLISQQALERKARIYKDIKRGRLNLNDQGEGVGGLLDIGGSDSDNDGYSDQSDHSGHGNYGGGVGDEEMVEIEDSFGRTRSVPRSQAALYGHPTRKVSKPGEVIYGDIIQHDAFIPDRDRIEGILSQNPLEGLEQHYDSKWEVRNRGVGFYQFSTDMDVRSQQMESLRNMRNETMVQGKEFQRLRDTRTQRLKERSKQILDIRAINLEKLRTS